MKFRITIDDRLYEADLEIVEDEPGGVAVPRTLQAPSISTANTGSPTPARTSFPPPAQPSVPPPAGGEGFCVSNVMGVVVRLLVEKGAEVAEGTPLVVLEAMKMESTLNAPRAGKIKQILVAPGDAVKREQPLLEIG